MAQHLNEILALVQKAFALPDLPDSLLRRMPASLHDRVHPSIPSRETRPRTQPGSLHGDPVRLKAPTILEESERLQAMEIDIGHVLAEVRPDEVRVLMPEQTYKDSYARIAPRVTLETLVRLSCVRADIPVEMLHRASARSRLGFPRKGKFEQHISEKIEPVGKCWKTGRNLAAAAALAGDG